MLFHALNRCAEFHTGKRFQNVVKNAGLDGAFGIGIIIIPGDDQDTDFRIQLPYFVTQGQAVHDGHANVGEHDIHRVVHKVN